MKFEKPSLSVNDQIALLERRGMAVPNRAEAEHYLRHLSYYRLRAYWLPFERPCDIEGDHVFQDGTCLTQAVKLYMFDRELRLLIMDAIERIEVSLRGGWAHHLAMKFGPHGYLDPGLYERPDRYAKAYAGLLEEIERSKDTFIIHYGGKYSDPKQPPIWMTAEVMSLGQLSKWLGNLKYRHDRQAIARPYGVDEKILVSIAHHLTYIRNICAHHGRLWNKQFTVTMTVPNAPASLKLAMNAESTRKIYNTVVALAYLVEIVAPGSGWRYRVAQLIESCDLASPKAMGFPDDWKGRPFWRARTA
ncbi:Abi family protein [Brevundimonas diminuta ATCC 11568]|jgi:abortive infection bacteriophage resistance protein